MANSLNQEEEPKPYWSQRSSTRNPGPRILDLPTAALRIRSLADELDRRRFFSKAVGYDCYDREDARFSSVEDQLAERVQKPELWTSDPRGWTEDDLCDFTEVLHDLVARPTRERYHSWNGCGWHPEAWSVPSGRRLYAWWVNQILRQSDLGLELSEGGDDAGRIVRTAPEPLLPLVSSMADSHAAGQSEVAHAIAMFRDRNGTRDSRRSAVVALARVLEDRRDLLRRHLFKKDEGTLFELANGYDLRHRNDSQKTGYGDEFLTWIFYYYLATIQLTDDLLVRERAGRESSRS